MKRVNRLFWLGLLALLAMTIPAAEAQNLNPMTIGTTQRGATFFVDGQRYTENTVFTWAEGTSHVVQFPYSADANGMLDVQYLTFGSRFRFHGWTATYTGPQPGDFTDEIEVVVASKNFTSLIADLTAEYRVRLNFPQAFNSTYCEDFIAGNLNDYDIDSFGVVFFDGNCINQSTEYWLEPGSYDVHAYNYPGWVFTGLIADDQLLRPRPLQFTLDVVNSMIEYTFHWEPSKRIRFATYPPGRELLIDGNKVTPRFYYYYLYSDANSGGQCTDFHKLPVGTTIYRDWLCVGDFEYAVGTQHTVAAPVLQRQIEGQYWVFDHFSNGMPNNSVLTVPGDTNVTTTIQAVFVKGVPLNVISNYPGLKVSVDGKNDWTGINFGAIWGVGQKHTVSAPATITDADGRVYRFVRWSDGGAATHDVVIPESSDGLALTVFWELLGRVTITSTPPGLQVTVNGASCTTPCGYDQPVGTVLTAEAAATIPFGEDGRLTFARWDPSGSTTLQQTLTFTKDVQVLNAVFKASRSILTATDPAGTATFTFNPPSADGFYADGTTVQVTAVAKPGFRFLRWTGDLSTSTKTGAVVVRGVVRLIAKMEAIPPTAPLSVRNAAGSGPVNALAPGSLFAIYSEDLANGLTIGPSNPLATSIANTSIFVDDAYRLPLVFVSPKQINGQLLSNLANGSHTITFRSTGREDRTATISVQRNAPGLFYTLTPSGMPLLSAVHENGTPITEASPAVRGETISFYGTGFGPYDLPPVDGFVMPVTYTYKLIDPVKVLVGVPVIGAEPSGDTEPKEAAEATVQPVEKDPVAAIGASGMVGASLIKLKLDTDLPVGNILEISVTSNGVASNKVQLPVK